jgi:hypothetical protein
MANRLLGHPDRRRLRRNLIPSEWVVRDWENLTRQPDGDWQPTWHCAADPKEQVSKRGEALQILKERYEFSSENAVVKYLGRHGVKDLPDRTY